MTCAIVVVVLMLLLWPTFNSPDFVALTDMNTLFTNDYGAGGHFWIILLMLLNPSIFLNMDSPVFGINQPLEDMVGIGAFILILALWFIGSFAGGLASRGGLRSGLWSAVFSYLFLSFLFATVSGSLGGVSTGGLLAFIVNLFAPMVFGSFFVIPVLGMAGGIVGGILGKMLFTKSKKKDDKDDKTEKADKEEAEPANVEESED